MNQIAHKHAPEILRRKKALEMKLRELLRTAVAREDLEIEYLADPLDQIKANTDRELAIHSLDQKARLVHDIQFALESIEDGTYGVCEDCEEPIPGRRLDAVPWARLCVRCQERQESTGSEPEAVYSRAA